MGKPPSSYLQRWASHLHPHVPPSSLDSQRLLRLLNTEFQKRLDLKHPLPQSITNQQTLTTPPRSLRAKTSRDAPHPSPYRSASDHLDSILSNPLFTFSQTRPTKPFKAHQSKKKVDAVAWFISKVATGTADLAVAKCCLGAVLEQAKVMKSSESKQYLEDLQAGWHVLDWMRSSGEESRDGWKRDRAFCRMLARCLVAEEYSDVVLAWLRQPMLSNRATWSKSLAQGYVAAKYSYNGGLDSAIRAFVECSKARSLCVAQGQAVPNFQLQDLENIGSRIAQAVLAREDGRSVSPQDYDDFTGILSTWTNQAPFMSVALGVYHPTRPTAKPLLDLLRKRQLNVNHMDSLALHLAGVESSAVPVGVCLDAAELLFSQQNFNAGSQMLAHIKQVVAPSSDEEHKSSLPTDLEDGTRDHVEAGNLAFG